MARRASSRKYPLLVYRYIAVRYRPAGILMFIFGLIAQIPRFVPELRVDNGFITYDQLSLLGLVGVVAGVVLWIASIFEARQAYVQCRPEYLLINTASGRLAVSYLRINSMKTIKVADVFPVKQLRGRQRAFIKPLARESALEVLVSDFPIPEQQARRRLSQFLFSTRDKGFVFIVPNYGDLKVEINGYQDSARMAEIDATRGGYVNPMERVR